MNEIQRLRQMGHALALFRDEYTDAPTQALQVFLLVATNPRISSKGAMKRANVSQSAVSRFYAHMGQVSWRGDKGCDLIEVQEDPEDRRNRVAFLTIRGKNLAIRLAKTLDPLGADPDPDNFLTAADYARRPGAR